MFIIRTEDEMSHVAAAFEGNEVHSFLQAHAERLSAYDGFNLSELAMFLIVQPADRLEAIEDALNWSLIDDAGTFIQPAEVIARHSDWYEATFILSDDGYGLILFVPIAEGTEPKLIAACEQAFTEFSGSRNT